MYNFLAGAEMNTITDAIFATNTINNIRVLDLKCGTELMHYNSGVIKPKCLNIMQNDYVLAAEEGPLIYAWPINSSEKLQSIRMLCPGKIGCFSLSPDGLYIAVSVDNKLLLWQVSSKKRVTNVDVFSVKLTICFDFRCLLVNY